MRMEGIIRREQKKKRRRIGKEEEGYKGETGREIGGEQRS
jgi:hypothetical protein